MSSNFPTTFLHLSGHCSYARALILLFVAGSGCRAKGLHCKICVASGYDLRTQFRMVQGFRVQEYGNIEVSSSLAARRRVGNIELQGLHSPPPSL